MRRKNMKAKKIKLTERQKEEYLNSCGNHCPYCKSENIDSIGSVETDDNYGWRNVLCNDCKKEWQDVYTLTSIDEK